MSGHSAGVPEDILPRLFEAFVRIGEARDRASGGYGLGLAIAHQAIRLHSGRIWAPQCRRRRLERDD